jgi:putative transposase
VSLHRGPVPAPTAANQHWSMDIVHDQLHNGRRFRVLTVIDQWGRESVSVSEFARRGQETKLRSCEILATN